MNLFIKNNIYSDFLKERILGLDTCKNSTDYREISPWDLVGAQSKAEHGPEVKAFLEANLGSYEILNKYRQFNLCSDNPYNFAHVHYDDFDYIMIIYLNLPTQIGPKDGTLIVSHKETGENCMTQNM